MQMLKFSFVKQILNQNGYEIDRYSASHVIFKNEAGDTISIPYHSKRVSPVLVQAEFRKHNIKGWKYGNKK